MRNPESDPSDPQASDAGELPAHEAGSGHREEALTTEVVVRGVVNSSPWVVVSILAHVILFAVLGVIYLGHDKKPDTNVGAIDMGMSAKPVETQVPPEEPPEIIDRNSVPVLPDQQEGIVNPDVNYIPDAAPGKQGEIIPDQTDPTKEAGIYNPDPEALSNLPSGATGGTAIGVGTMGHLGNGVSAFSSRRAGGGGRGGGGLGQGGGGGRGGFTDKTEAAVLSALKWLAKHQSSDGRWDCDGFDAMCSTNKCEGRGEATYDPGVTGLALLCFLGAGYTHQSGPFRNTVKEGLKYLKSIQTEEGLFGPQTSQHYQYNHACAALAMAEAFGMTQANAFRESAQLGVGWVLKTKNPYHAWRYGVADGDNDTSVTGWMTMVLKSGKLAGLESEHQALVDAVSWVDEMTDPMTGRTGYQTKGTGPARTQGKAQEQFPAENSEALTAVGMLVRIFAGHKASEDPLILKGADLCLQRLPKWDPPHIDFYYWYYGSLSMYQVGGNAWNKWNEAMKTAIIDHQRTDTTQDEYGSWDPIDPWSAEGGRVYSTAVLCLCMEVYYRYDRVFGLSTDKEAPKPAPKGQDGK